MTTSLPRCLLASLGLFLMLTACDGDGGEGPTDTTCTTCADGTAGDATGDATATSGDATGDAKGDATAGDTTQADATGDATAGDASDATDADVVLPDPLVVDPATTAAFLGAPLDFALSAAGGVAPYAWSATGLPTGLEIVPRGTPLGLITGAPGEVGDFDVSVTVTDAAGTATTQSVSLSVTTSQAYAFVDAPSNGDQTLYLVDTSAGTPSEPTLLATGSSQIGSLAWSPDGRWLSYRIDDAVEIVDVTASPIAPTEISDGIPDLDRVSGAPTWSRDASRFVLPVILTDGPALYLIDAATLTGGRLDVTDPADRLIGFSPDSSKVAWTSGDGSIWMYDALDERLGRIHPAPNDFQIYDHVIWSRTSRYLYFTSTMGNGVDGSFRLYRTPVDGAIGAPEAIGPTWADTGVFVEVEAVGPVDDWVAYQGNPGGRNSLWISTIGGSATDITQTGSSGSIIDLWTSPVGDRLAVSVQRSNGGDMYVVDLDAASPGRTEVTSGYPGFDDGYFSPDGRWFAYTRLTDARDGAELAALDLGAETWTPLSVATALFADQDQFDDIDWSPSGYALSYQTLHQDASEDAYVATFDGGAATSTWLTEGLITDGESVTDTSPLGRFSPAGDGLLFELDGGFGNRPLYWVDLSGAVPGAPVDATGALAVPEVGDARFSP